MSQATAESALPTPRMVEAITLGEREVLLTHDDVDPSDLRLNPDNARIQFLASGLGEELKESKLEELLWEIDDVRKLMSAIKRNGGLVERIIVAADGTVIEGNCRTVVYRKLRNLEPDEPRWQRIPARVLPGEITQQQIDILLGELHIAGKNKWTPFEKAGYVYRMQKVFGWSQGALAEHLRTSKSAVNQMVRAYALMKERFLPAYQDQVKDPDQKYSYFLEFYKKMGDRAEEYDGPFVNWVGIGKLTKGAQVRDLPAIVSNKSALEALEKDGHEAAMNVLAVEDPARTSKLFATMDRLIRELQAARADEINSLRVGDISKQRKVRELYQAVLDFAEMAQVQLEGDGRKKR
jgi:hypothetical protein